MIHLDKIFVVFSLSVLFCFGINPNTTAQDTLSIEVEGAKFLRLSLQNGKILDGELISEDEYSFQINTLELGIMTIAKVDVVSKEYITEDEVSEHIDKQRMMDLNPQSSRYFFAPSAFQLKKGDGYIHNTWVVFNQVSYGITDHFTAGFTMTPFGVGGSVKLGMKLSEKSRVSAGGIAVQSFSTRSLSGVSFVNFTRGTEQKNMSISYGYGFHTATDGEKNDLHIVNLSLMLEISDDKWIISENYALLDQGDFIYSMGIRRSMTWAEMMRNSMGSWWGQNSRRGNDAPSSQGKELLYDYGVIFIDVDELPEIFNALSIVRSIPIIPWVGLTIPF